MPGDLTGSSAKRPPPHDGANGASSLATAGQRPCLQHGGIHKQSPLLVPVTRDFAHSATADGYQHLKATSTTALFHSLGQSSSGEQSDKTDLEMLHNSGRQSSTSALEQREITDRDQDHPSGRRAFVGQDLRSVRRDVDDGIEAIVTGPAIVELAVRVARYKSMKRCSGSHEAGPVLNERTAPATNAERDRIRAAQFGLTKKPDIWHA
ncbi:hypothetical protein V8E36_008969 [Tilletia maclaganii]